MLSKTAFSLSRENVHLKLYSSAEFSSTYKKRSQHQTSRHVENSMHFNSLIRYFVSRYYKGVHTTKRKSTSEINVGAVDQLQLQELTLTPISLLECKQHYIM